MKTLIIATILSAGVLLRPPMAPMETNCQGNQKAIAAKLASTTSGALQTLSTQEMQSTRGAGILECYNWTDQNKDSHAMCCVNLWLFKICLDVNVSDIERVINSVI
jgi:hypothetical protein